MHHAARLCAGLLAFFSAGVFAADPRVDLDQLADEPMRALLNLIVDYMESSQKR